MHLHGPLVSGCTATNMCTHAACMTARRRGLSTRIDTLSRVLKESVFRSGAPESLEVALTDILAALLLSYCTKYKSACSNVMSSCMLAYMCA